MRTQLRALATAAAVSIPCLFSAASLGEEAGAPVSAALTELSALKTWLADGPNGPGWNRYLKLPEVEAELAKGNDADPATLAAAVAKLDGSAPGLELTPFRKFRDALAQWSEELTLLKGADLHDAILASESKFRPLTDADVAADKAALETATAKLDRFLKISGANGAAWREYLHWSDLQTQLKSATVDLSVLKSVQKQFRADQNGLEMPVYSDVAAALDRYITDAEAPQDLKAQFAEQLKGLSDELRLFDKDRSQERAAAVGARLGWLQNTRQVDPLTRVVRGKISHPNLQVAASGRLVGAGIAQPVDETLPVTDVILGTDISGTARTVGKIDVELVPSANKAMLDAMLEGTAHSKTVGYNGPAAIHANGTTNVRSRKRLVIDERGLTSYPATATAVTRTQIAGVAAGNGGIVQRIATKKVYESKSEAEVIGARHAADRVRHRVDAQVLEQLSKAQNDYLQKIRNPLIRRREFPSLLKFRTTTENMFVTALQANASQLAALSEAPQVDGEHDLVVRVHESMVNNLADALLSGVTWKEADVQAKVIELRGSLPEQLKSDNDKDPWSITFANSKPVVVKFNESGFQVTIRGQKYTSGERDFRAMNITANYKVEISGNGSRAIRQGDLVIVPPNFAPGKTLSTQQITLKTLLQKRFGKLFEPEMKSDGLVLPGKWREAGRLDLKHFSSDVGWLAMAWIESGEPAPPEEDKVALKRR